MKVLEKISQYKEKFKAYQNERLDKKLESAKVELQRETEKRKKLNLIQKAEKIKIQNKEIQKKMSPLYKIQQNIKRNVGKIDSSKPSTNPFSPRNAINQKKNPFQ